jgi:hypothetical protein
MISQLGVRFAMAASVAVAVSACTRTLSVSPVNPAQLTVENGRPALRSQLKNRVEVVLLHREFSYQLASLPAFDVTVWNAGDTPFVFSTKNVTAFSGDAPVRVYTSGQLEARARHDSELAVELEAHTAWDVGPANSAIARSREAGSEMDARHRAENIGEAGQGRMRWIESLLRSQEVGPGQMAGGVVKLNNEDIKTGRPLRLVVTVGGEEHPFVFDVGN